MLSVITPSIRPQFLNITQECLEQQSFTDFEWLVEIGLRNHGFQLPKDLNRAIARAKGERIVMLQDCIRIAPDALARINDLPNEFYTFPVGQVRSFEEQPVWDWRKTPDRISPNMWEADFACAPTKAFFDLGGYDETYCGGWSFDNVELGWRADAAGYTIHCDPSIEGVALRHDDVIPNPFRHSLPLNDRKAEETRLLASRGKYKLNYL